MRVYFEPLCLGRGCILQQKSIIKLLENGYKVKEVQKGTIEQASAKLGINLPRL